jgi:hypothetical protein
MIHEGDVFQYVDQFGLDKTRLEVVNVLSSDIVDLADTENKDEIHRLKVEYLLENYMKVE